MVSPSKDRVSASRFEFKYWIPPDLVPEVRRCIRPFVRPDRFALGREGLRYPISSLYLDTPALDLYRGTTEAHKNRFKLRIRAYTDREEDLVFLEIKKRANLIVRKRRVAVKRSQAIALLQGRLPSGVRDAVFEEFAQLTMRIGARPMLRVRYKREAYESTGRDPVRVTLDTELMHSVTPDADLGLANGRWEETPTEGIILEVKFTDACPSWATNMLRTLGLERTSVPKYVLSVDRAKAMRIPLSTQIWKGSKRRA